MVTGKSYVLELLLELGQHHLLNDEMGLIKVLDNVLVAVAVDVDDDRLDGRVALDENACYVVNKWTEVANPGKGWREDQARG